LYIDDDDDLLGPGEVSWLFSGYANGASFDIYTNYYTVPVNSGTVLDFTDVSVIISVPHTPTEQCTIYFQLHEDGSDEPWPLNGDHDSNLVSQTWTVGGLEGSYLTTIYADGGPPIGTMYYSFEKVD
jgi:hypothetical protein